MYFRYDKNNIMNWELRNLGEQLSNFVVGTEGNISKRTSKGFIIKASGHSLKYMDLDAALVSCDIAGSPLKEEGGKPSMETSFHSWIYSNSDFKFIAHTHPTNTLKILCTDYLVNEFAIRRFFPDQVVFNGEESCVVLYATPGEELTEEIKASVFEYKNKHNEFPKLLLLKNHGIICCANTAKEAVIMTEICEKSAEIFMGVKALCSPSHCLDSLSDSEIKSLVNNKHEKYRKELI